MALQVPAFGVQLTQAQINEMEAKFKEQMELTEEKRLEAAIAEHQLRYIE